MKTNVLHTDPVRTPRTNRNHPIQVVTSGKPGVVLPIAFIPGFREDRMNGGIDIDVEMMEGKELFLNKTFGRFMAFAVPFLALGRFKGSIDELNKSYVGEAGIAGAIIPFIETELMGTTAIYDVAGIPGNSADVINTIYKEAYNLVWNMRATNRSRDITPRARLDGTLAKAFWPHGRFAHIVPDFDQAVIDGEVALKVVSQNLAVKGLGVNNSGAPGKQQSNNFRETGGTGTGRATPDTNNASTNPALVEIKNGFPAVYAALPENGITISLSDIDLAKKARDWAKKMELYEGHDDNVAVDLLLQGIHVPDQHLKQPILLADRMVDFRQAKRYATDAANLAESATSGATRVSLPIRVPQINTGYVVVVTAEFFPDQLWERQQDPFFHTTNHLRTETNEGWPNAMADDLDPEKVSIVKNRQIDTSHGTPNGTFGYAPLHWQWTTSGQRIGGKFLRRTAGAPVDTDRMRFWAEEKVNPTLSSDFYLVSALHQKPFLDTEADPFEIACDGNVVINGNTVFGGLLVEATNNYDKVMEKAPVERIEKAS